jgi:hypothetical protein
MQTGNAYRAWIRLGGGERSADASH